MGTEAGPNLILWKVVKDGGRLRELIYPQHGAGNKKGGCCGFPAPGLVSGGGDARKRPVSHRKRRSSLTLTSAVVWGVGKPG